MGYAHYFCRKTILDSQQFQLFARDCATLASRSDIPIAGWDGTGEPVFTDTEVAFNGVESCGHPVRDLGITFPDENASGINMQASPTQTWFAGTLLSQRTCDGDCSCEGFRIAQHYQGNSDYRKPFDCCKTAYKPYDLLVTACLISAKHHFDTDMAVISDGDSNHWDDARQLCQHVLGYGANFVLG